MTLYVPVEVPNVTRYHRSLDTEPEYVSKKNWKPQRLRTLPDDPTLSLAKRLKTQNVRRGIALYHIRAIPPSLFFDAFFPKRGLVRDMDIAVVTYGTPHPRPWQKLMELNWI